MGPHIHSNIQRYERVLWLLSREVDLDIQLDTGTKTVVGTHDAETWNELVHEARAQREAIEEETVGYESVLQQLRREAEMLARGSCNAPATDGGEKAMDAQGRVDEQLTDAKREEDELTRDLKAISKERESVQESLLVLAQEEHHLQDAEAHYWQTLNGLQNDVMCHTEQRDSLQQQIGALRSQLSRLQRTNVINDAFYIWVDGPFGTINSFRMGRLPNIFVRIMW
jgi:beclin 1